MQVARLPPVFRSPAQDAMEQVGEAEMQDTPQQQQQEQPPAAEQRQQQQQTAEPPGTAGTLHMNAGSFCDDLHNAVHFYCADGFDTLDSTLREQRGAALTPEQQASALHGSSQVYLALRAEVDAQLQKFEAYALETCLHVPAGLLVEAPSTSGPDGEVAAVDEGEEAAVDEQLAQLRQQIAAAKHQGRKLAGEVARYDAVLGQYSSSLAVLEGVVPGALGAAGKENAVTEDSRALAAAAMALEDSCRQLEGLRAQRRAGSASAGTGGSEPLAPRDELAAEKEILRRQAALRSAPADSLRRLQERLAT